MRSVPPSPTLDRRQTLCEEPTQRGSSAPAAHRTRFVQISSAPQVRPTVANSVGMEAAPA